MRYLVIPDIHGRTFWKDVTKNIDDYDKVIFLGDYLDPYPFEHISEENAITNFLEIIDFAEQHSDKIIMLLGNHDLHYINSDFAAICGGSRYMYKYAEDINNIFMKHIKMFHIIYQTDKTLFSHAGVFKSWLDKWNLTLGSDFDKLILQTDTKHTFRRSKTIPLADVSYYRGGESEIGSCVWSDVDEKREVDESGMLINVMGINKYQIFGHTLQVHWKDSSMKEIEFGNPIICYCWAMLDNGSAYSYDEDTKEIVKV